MTNETAEPKEAAEVGGSLLEAVVSLLPCPWCGGDDIYARVSDICCPVQYSAIARCRDCGAEAPDGSGVKDSREDAEREAFEMWNDRAS